MIWRQSLRPMSKRSKTGAVIGVAVASAVHLQPYDGGAGGVRQAGFPLEYLLAPQVAIARKWASSAKNILPPVHRAATVRDTYSAAKAYRRTGSALRKRLLDRFSTNPKRCGQFRQLLRLSTNPKRSCTYRHRLPVPVGRGDDRLRRQSLHKSNVCIEAMRLPALPACSTSSIPL